MDRDMKRQWDIEELIEHFTLVDEDKDVLENKTGATLLGCALLLKCFARCEARRRERAGRAYDPQNHEIICEYLADSAGVS